MILEVILSESAKELQSGNCQELGTGPTMMGVWHQLVFLDARPDTQVNLYD